MNKVLLILTLMIFMLAPNSFAASKKFDLEVFYGGYYESNVFHSYEDSLETASMLNNLKIDLSKKIKSSKKLTHKFSSFADIDFYPSYSDRNKTSFGVQYEPDYKYSKKGKFSGDFSFSRRNKDLIDDSGQLLSRTLKKTNLTVGLKHRYKFNKLTTEQYFELDNHNYDETYDINNVKATSYDYKSTYFGGSLKYKFDKKIKAKFKIQTEKRNYDERFTYAVVTGVRAGGRLGIREFRENSYDFGLEYEFSKGHSISFESDFSRRNENYENFYGYDQWQHRAKLKLAINEKNDFEFSVRSKSKDYENYHTANTRAISPFERVSVDYLDIQIKDDYQISPSIVISFFAKNYDKTSNDISFEYKDVTLGAGINWTY